MKRSRRRKLQTHEVLQQSRLPIIFSIDIFEHVCYLTLCQEASASSPNTEGLYVAPKCAGVKPSRDLRNTRGLMQNVSSVHVIRNRDLRNTRGIIQNVSNYVDANVYNYKLCNMKEETTNYYNIVIYNTN